MKYFTQFSALLALAFGGLSASAAEAMPQMKSMSAELTATTAADGLITGQPAGTVKMYARSGGAYYAQMGNPRMVVYQGVEARFVEGTDGAWYLYSGLSQADTRSYMKFDKQADGSLVANLPQASVLGKSDGEEFTLYLNKMKYTVLEGEGTSTQATYKVDTTDNKIVYTLGEDGSWTMQGSDEGDVILGLSDEDGNWYGYGEFETVFTPFDYELVTPPASLTTEQWSMTYGSDGHNVNIGFDGDDVYFQGLIGYFTEAWVKGTLADGKITVPSGQYVGIEPSEVHYCFFTGADVEAEWNDYYEKDIDKFIPNEAAVFDYDADNKTMTLDGGIVLATLDNVTVYQALGIKNPKLQVAGDDISLIPADPVITEYEPYDDEYEMAGLEFEFPKVNVDGILLNTDNLYYRIYSGTEVFEFTPDEYVGLEEPMTLVPYGFEDENWDFAAWNETHTLFFYFDIQNVGVQTVYVDTDGTEYCSKIVYAEEAGEEELTSYIPADPEITDYEPYDADEESGTITFEQPTVNVDDQELDTDKLFFRLYTDDTVYVFSADVYGIDEDMTLIPYGFEDDNWYIAPWGTEHTVVFFASDYSRMGVQSVYVTDDGEEHCSEIVYTEARSGVDSIVNNASPVVEETIYDVTGRRIERAVKGVNVIHRTHADGSITIVKKAVK